MTGKQKLSKVVSDNIAYLARQDIDLAVDLVVRYLSSQLTKHMRIEIRNFGSFAVRQRKKAGEHIFYNTVYYRMAKRVAMQLNDATK